MAAADTATTTEETPAEAPAKPAALKAPVMVTDGLGRYGLVVGSTDDGTPLVSWLPEAGACGLEITKV